jgi:hypothetical protein
MMAQSYNLDLLAKSERERRLSTTTIRGEVAAFWLARLSLELNAAIRRRADRAGPTLPLKRTS